MQDRYLFRGKRLDNGEWVKGSLEVTNNNKTFIWIPQAPLGLVVEVNPATVGQCTGLHSAISYRGVGKEERLIFEGDILFDGFDRYIAKYSETQTGIHAVPMVCSMSWSLYHLVNRHNCGREIEIIGTIHDTKTD